MKKILLILTICYQLALGQINSNITGDELNRLQETIEEKEAYLVIDLRNANNYKKGHLKHAINIPINILQENFKFLNTSREENIVLISDKTQDIQNAVNTLEQLHVNKKIILAPDYQTYNYTLYMQNNIKGKDLQNLADKADVVILDARKEKDYLKGHFKNAINVPEAQLTPEILNRIKEASHNGSKPIITHCYRGNDGNKLAQLMLKEGFKNVTNSIDGTREFEFKFK